MSLSLSSSKRNYTEEVDKKVNDYFRFCVTADNSFVRSSECDELLKEIQKTILPEYHKSVNKKGCVFHSMRGSNPPKVADNP